MSNKPTETSYIDSAQAAKIVRGHPSAATVWRWATRGIQIPDGARLRMKHIRMGGKILTTEVWVFEFAESLAKAYESTPTPSPTKTIRNVPAAQRQRQIADAKRELAKK